MHTVARAALGSTAILMIGATARAQTTSLITTRGDTALADTSGFVYAPVGLHRISASLETGLAFARAGTTGLPDGLDSRVQRATMIAGNAALDFDHLHMAAGTAISKSEAERGGVGHIMAAFDRDDANIAWRVAADVTQIRTSGLNARTIAVVATRVGTASHLQSELVVGGRHQATYPGRDVTPLASLRVGHIAIAPIQNGALYLGMFAAAAHTRLPTLRAMTDLPDVPYVTDGLAYRDNLAAPMRSVTIADLTLTPMIVSGRLELRGDITGRLGAKIDVARTSLTPRQVWQPGDAHVIGGAARITWHVSPGLAFLAEAERRLSSPMFDVGGVRYAALSLRVSFPRPRPLYRVTSTMPTVATPVHPVVNTEIRSSSAQIFGRASDGSRLVMIYSAATDSTTDIAGDFTNWQPSALWRCTTADTGGVETAAGLHTDDITWCGRFTIPAGAHHLVYRTNRGSWHVPSGLVAIHDEYEGTVGLIAVP